MLYYSLFVTENLHVISVYVSLYHVFFISIRFKVNEKLVARESSQLLCYRVGKIAFY